MVYGRIDPRTRRLIVGDLTPSIRAVLKRIETLNESIDTALSNINDVSEKLLVLQGLMLEHIRDASTAEPDVEALEEEIREMLPEVKD